MRTTRATGSSASASIILVRRSSEALQSVVIDVPDRGADVDQVERALIAFALDTAGGNRTRAARFLHLSRSALIYRMHKHGLVQEPSLAGSDPHQRQQQQ